MKVLKVKSVLHVYALMVSKFFGALLRRKWKFFLASMKTLEDPMNLKILNETLFKMLVAEFRKPPVIL